MTNTKFRKRMLLSSVAMLLVALVALGSATFAWFTSSTSAYADKLSVKTIKASELKVSKSSGDWTDHLEYGINNKILKPASTADGINWFVATAAGKGASDADVSTVAPITVTNNSGDYVFKEQLNVKNAGSAAVNDVKIKFTLSEQNGDSATNYKYLRVALVPAASRGADKGFLSGQALTGHVYAAGADTANGIASLTPASGDDPATITTTAVAATNASTEVSITVGNGTLAANAEYYYNLYVWFEGQDTDCSDAHAGNSMPEITFTVDGATASQT